MLFSRSISTETYSQIMTSVEQTVGVIGLGNIGGRIASVLLEEYSVVVFDIDADQRTALVERGAVEADTVVEVGNTADVVLLSLPNEDAVEDVVFGQDGVLGGLSEDNVLIDTSTVSPMLSQEVASACAEHDIHFLDAPVSGGARNAETGSLTVLVGGSEKVLGSVQSVLETISETIHHVGEQGNGATLKVINNYMFGMNQLVLCEGLTMARTAGISDETFAATVADSSGASYALNRNMDGFILPDKFESEFTLSLMRKDVSIGEQFASDNDVPLLLGNASGFYRTAEQLGYGQLDSSSIIKLYDSMYKL